MKRIFALLLAIVMTLMIASCGYIPDPIETTEPTQAPEDPNGITPITDLDDPADFPPPQIPEEDPPSTPNSSQNIGDNDGGANGNPSGNTDNGGEV